MAEKLARLTLWVESSILFLMSAALCGGALLSLWYWWQAFSVMLVTGFISYAQDAITDYYEQDNEDVGISLTVLLLGVSYAALFAMCFAKQNETVGAELFGGFILFVRKIRRETAVPTPPDGTISVVSTISPVVPEKGESK